MLLTCENLSFAYGTDPVLRGISLSLRAGEIIALLGPNGSGKSTLLRCLLGQLYPSGQVRWDNKPLSQWRHRDLARRAAYLPQAPALESSQSVADVLRMGRAPFLGAFGIESQRDMEVVREVAGLLGLAELIQRPIDELSGGQRQRVYLGRCLVQEPAVLLLDEPNTYLDLRHQVEMGQLLKSLARTKNIAVLMASHDLNLAGQFADRLVLLDQGTVAADGTPGHVLQAELLAHVYGVPMSRHDYAGGIYVVPGVTEMT